MGTINSLKTILKLLYRIFPMPYLKRDRYFEELVDGVYKNDIPIILSQIENDYN